jgi:Fe-S-cluster containining protein
VKPLRFDANQHFTCRQCGRCCRGWDVPVTASEVEAYRKVNVARLFRERDGGEEGTSVEPFVPVPGRTGHYRIRKRPDGTCGFLSPAGLCRIHEELGARRKPLACRLFPFRLHPSDGAPLLTASFSCPTIVANAGTSLGDQLEGLSVLRKDWQQQFDEAVPERRFVAGRPVAGAVVGTLRLILRRMLDRPGANGGPDLRANVARMAATLDDLTRWRVVRLPAEGFAEYLELTGGFAASSPSPALARAPSRLARLLFRGLLLAVAAARLQARGPKSGLRLGLRLRLLRLAAHLHGLGPATEEVDLRAAGRSRLDLNEADVRGLVYHYLRSTLETLGTGRRPVMEELSLAIALLNAGTVLAAMRAGREGRTLIAVADLTAGLTEASDLQHAEGGVLSPLLATLAGGVESLHAFASGRIL